MDAPAGSIVVATLNVRNRADRWKERSGLLIDQLIALQPDIIGLQEVIRPVRQAAWIRREVNRRLPPGEPRYEIVCAWKSGIRRFWEGIAIMSRLPNLETERLALAGGSRVAQRARVRLPSGGLLDFYNTHLHHPYDADDLRLAQARQTVAWIERHGDTARVLVGDFNSEPDSEAVRFITGTLRSAFGAVHGFEPELTSPTLLNRREDAHLAVIDFIFVDPRLTIHDAWLTFDLPHDDDDHLFPSDHFGLAARIAEG
ncbi:MAG TPA: endonuclease/exonuclease/phosphatase family protein [Thermomicrobiales bacterium]|nr:endonuclease/exonuclease/phosphatase family protein [Thermomicrobiales bacterium]